MSEIRFTVAGTPQAVSRAIEQYAHGEGRLNAIVVPWESDAVTVSMAVTAVKADGWAIEHTNLGTIRLTDAGRNLTELAVTAEPPEHPEVQQLLAVFDRFIRQIQSRFRAEA